MRAGQGFHILYLRVWKEVPLDRQKSSMQPPFLPRFDAIDTHPFAYALSSIVKMYRAYLITRAWFSGRTSRTSRTR